MAATLIARESRTSTCKILWEELLARFEHIQVVSEPEIVQSNFVRGYSKMMVKLTLNATCTRTPGVPRFRPSG